MSLARCSHCEREMLTASTCELAEVTIEGHTYERIRWGDETPTVQPEAGGTPLLADIGVVDRCGDCNVEPGAVHHVHCDMEACPRGHIQLLTCQCKDPLFG